MANLLIEALRSSLQRTGLWGSRVVVALSGGPDSLALALGLADLLDEARLTPLVAHFDHRLRSESSDDAAFVARFGETLGWPVSIGSGDVRVIARQERVGLEEAGRRARYRFLAECCDRFRAAAVLVAHTADDQAETRLMHVVRGSGLTGLVGMTEDSVLELSATQKVRVVRPLLDVRREATVAFCRARQAEPREDPSNFDLSFTRNRLRQTVIPALKAMNPRLDQSLDRLARQADAAEQFIQAELDRRIDGLVATSESEWRIDRTRWRDLPRALKFALLRRATEALGRRGEGVDADNLDDAARAADGWPAGRSLDWPAGLEVRVEHASIVIRRDSPADRRIAPREVTIDLDHDIPVHYRTAPDHSNRDGRAIQVRRRRQRCHSAADDRWHCDLDAARIQSEGPLVVRGRQAGDWICPTGMTGRKKVQDLLVDHHVPCEERDLVPIVATSKGIAWVAGVRRDRRYAATDETPDVVCLRVIAADWEPEGIAALDEAVRCTT